MLIHFTSRIFISNSDKCIKKTSTSIIYGLTFLLAHWMKTLFDNFVSVVHGHSNPSNKQKKINFLGLSTTQIWYECVLSKGSSEWACRVPSGLALRVPSKFSHIFLHLLFAGCFTEVLILVRYYLMSCYFITWIRIAEDVLVTHRRAYVLYCCIWTRER